MQYTFNMFVSKWETAQILAITMNSPSFYKLIHCKCRKETVFRWQATGLHLSAARNNKKGQL
jgi:hypothetical protein